jgi:hypothetical protein
LLQQKKKAKVRKNPELAYRKLADITETVKRKINNPGGKKESKIRKI